MLLGLQGRGHGDKEALVLLGSFTTSSGPEGFNFRQNGAALARLRLDGDQPDVVSITPVPHFCAGPPPTHWGAGLLRHQGQRVYQIPTPDAGVLTYNAKLHPTSKMTGECCLPTTRMFIRWTSYCNTLTSTAPSTCAINPDAAEGRPSATVWPISPLMGAPTTSFWLSLLLGWTLLVPARADRLCYAGRARHNGQTFLVQLDLSRPQPRKQPQRAFAAGRIETQVGECFLLQEGTLAEGNLTSKIVLPQTSSSPLVTLLTGHLKGNVGDPASRIQAHFSLHLDNREYRQVPVSLSPVPAHAWKPDSKVATRLLRYPDFRQQVLLADGRTLALALHVAPQGAVSGGLGHYSCSGRYDFKQRRLTARIEVPGGMPGHLNGEVLDFPGLLLSGREPLKGKDLQRQPGVLRATVQLAGVASSTFLAEPFRK